MSSREVNENNMVDKILGPEATDELTAQAYVDAAAERAKRKKARRQLRREIMSKTRRHAVRRTGMFSRDAQLKSYTRTLTDRFLAATKHVRTTVKPL